MKVLPLTLFPKEAPRLPAYLHTGVKSGIAWSLGFAVLVMGFGLETRAATKTWDGGAGTTAWGTANNWNANGIPGSADDVLFDNSSVATLPASVSLGGAQSANSLAFSTGDTLSLVDGSGNRTLTLTSGNITRSGSGTQSLAFNTLALSASGTWNIGGTGTFTVSSKVTGTGFGITKTGAGLLVLSGANTYTGATTIENGTLVVGANAPSASAGALGTASSAVALGDATSISSNLSPTLLTGGAFTVARTITVGSSNTATTGVYTIGGNTANASTFSGAITLNQSLSVSQVASGTTNLTGNITTGSSGTKTLTFNNAGSVSQSTGVISNGTGTMAVAQTGAGTTTLSGANTYTGGTAFNAGTVNVNSSGALGSSGTLSFGGGTLQYSASNTTDYSSRFSTAASQAYSIDTNGQSVTLATALASSGGSLAKSGTGTLTLSGTNTYTGGTTLSAGTLKASSTSAFGTTAGTLTLGGGTLDLATNTSIGAYNTNVTASSTIASDKATAASAGITHTLGTLAIGTSTLTLNSGTNVSANSAYGVAFGATTISGDATVSVANNGTATGTLTLGALTNGGSGSLTKTGAGTLAFSSTGNFNANLTLAAGTLALNGTNQTFGTLSVTGNSVIDFAGGNSTLTITSLVISAGVTLTITNWTDSLDYFYATNDPGSTTLAQVVFNPPTYTSANTHWVSVGGQITPVPEPATYGAMLLGAGLGFVLWRRRGGSSA
ncbi:MAG: autotransporter-associated beta strand repeat-containing protein [Verrucomicrobia bacterium]|nr:autotransporter-associated beta strand repeat-containing protein [Verrucomicrobiota bacterium]